MLTGDTIVAISSAVGAAARMIVRASGGLCRQLNRALAGSDQFAPATALRAELAFSGLSVPCDVYTFVAPHSATGEDVIEFHLPGNPLLARMLMDAIIRLGARQAEAGEFTARAYFNGRIDLSEAEGVAAAIAAQNRQELDAARQLLAGELSRRVRPVLDCLVQTLGLIETGIDFSDEDVSFLSAQQVRQRVRQADKALGSLLAQSARLERLGHEPQVVLAGRPNAGKSTLLNVLAGHDRAVVSAESGTTRDVLWAQVHLPHGVIRLIDIAGIEQNDEGPRMKSKEDPALWSIHGQMQDQAHRTLAQADLLVVVRDSTDDRPPLRLPRRADLRVASKSDLSTAHEPDEIPVSAKTGGNLDLLRDRLDKLVSGQGGGSAKLAINARHVQAIEQCRATLSRIEQYSDSAGAEILALELREALDSLGQILGQVSPDEVLGRIFATFCIGK